MVKWGLPETGPAIVPRLAGRWSPGRLATALGALGAGMAAAAILACGGPGIDLGAYLHASDTNPYGGAWGDFGAYVYSPAFLQVTWPLRQLPYDLAQAIWLAISSAALVLLAGPWTLPLLFAPPVIVELAIGNIHLLLAAAIVAGFRWPGAWAFVLLTKPTLGVGLLWFAARGEWRSLGIAFGAMAAIAGTSFVLAPDLWAQWFGLLSANAGAILPGLVVQVPLLPRLAAAAGVVIIGARKGWCWTVPIACLVAMPAVWFASLALLVAIIPLRYGAPRRSSPNAGR